MDRKDDEDLLYKYHIQKVITDCGYLAGVNVCSYLWWVRWKHADHGSFQECKAVLTLWHGWRFSQLEREGEMVKSKTRKPHKRYSWWNPRPNGVKTLTSSGPPLDGAHSGTVQDKLLSGWIICGCGLQPSKVCAWSDSICQRPPDTHAENTVKKQK